MRTIRYNEILRYIIGLPKTAYFNFKYFDFFTAIKLPVLISNDTWLKEMGGKVIIEGEIRPGMVQIGFGDIGIFDKHHSRSIWNVSGNVIFRGKANLGHGSKISVRGQLVIGNNVAISAESAIVCYKRIVLGENCVISWDNLIMDTDFHSVVDADETLLNEDKDIIIGNQAWIGCRCTILKGSSLGDNCIVGACTLLNKQFNDSNRLIAGTPARVIKGDVHFNKAHPEYSSSYKNDRYLHPETGDIVKDSIYRMQ